MRQSAASDILFQREIYIQSSAVLSLSYLLCKCLIKMDKCAVRECADMQAVPGVASGIGAAAVRLYQEKRPQREVLNPLPSHGIPSPHQGGRYSSPFYCSLQKTKSCRGRAHTERTREESTRVRAYALPNVWREQECGPYSMNSCCTRFICVGNKLCVCLNLARAKNFANGSFENAEKFPSISAAYP